MDALDDGYALEDQQDQRETLEDIIRKYGGDEKGEGEPAADEDGEEGEEGEDGEDGEEGEGNISFLMILIKKRILIGIIWFFYFI